MQNNCICVNMHHLRHGRVPEVGAQVGVEVGHGLGAVLRHDQGALHGGVVLRRLQQIRQRPPRLHRRPHSPITIVCSNCCLATQLDYEAGFKRVWRFVCATFGRSKRVFSFRYKYTITHQERTS